MGRTGQQAYPRDEALHFEHRIADVLRRADRQGETPRRASGLHRPVRSQTQGGTPRRMRRFRDDLRGDQLHFRRPGYRSRNHRSVPHSVRFDPGRPRLRTGRRRDGRRTALPGGQQPAAGRRHPGLQPEQEKRIPAPRLCQIGQSPGQVHRGHGLRRRMYHGSQHPQPARCR